MTDDFFIFTTEGKDLDAETAEFIKTIPAGHAEEAINAIDKAKDGDCADLNVLRANRDIIYPIDERLNAEDIEIDGKHGKIRLRLYHPKAKSDKRFKTLLYIHGGGWVIGSINSCMRVCQDLALKENALVAAVEYRLAPEHKYPKGLDDCESAYLWLANNDEKFGANQNKIYIAGDSAGGNLSIAVAMRMIETGGQKPRGLILYYPVTTLYGDYANAKSWRKYGDGFALDSVVMEAFGEAYLRDESDRASPYISPILYGSLGSLPPIFLQTSGHDILHDQAEEFAQKLYHAKVPVRYLSLNGATHIFMTMPGMDALYKRVLDETSLFIDKTV